jgi:hypothetical protein
MADAPADTGRIASRKAFEAAGTDPEAVSRQGREGPSSSVRASVLGAVNHGDLSTLNP